MSTHHSLYRKWRPQGFEDVVGQEHVVRTLTNALKADRLAHAYLFSGPRGTGKTTMARILSKGLNCQKGPTAEPCGECNPCRHIRDGSFLDVIEIDAASNRGIEEIRDLREKIRYAPSNGRYKVYILDEVHMLTTEAFNALLKVLEEPPAHAVFIFATTEPHRIPATIVSRCQRFDFRPLREEEVVSRLALIAEAEGIAVERGALELIARRAQGGMRDAEATLDQCISFQTDADAALSEGDVADILGVVPAERLVDYIGALNRRDGPAALRLIQQLSDEGRDLRRFNRDVIAALRGMLDVLVMGGEAGRAGNGGEADRDGSDGTAGEWSTDRLIDLIERLTAVDTDMRFSEEPRLPLELGVLRWLHPTDAADRAQSSVAPTPAAASPFDDADRSGQAVSDGDLRARVEELDRQLIRVTRALAGLQQEVQKLARGVAGASFAAPTAVAAQADPAGDAKPPRGAGASQGGRPPETAAAPAPAASEPPVDDAPLDLAQVGERWAEAMERLRHRSVKVEAFLREATPVGVTADGQIRVSFSPDHAFHLSNMQQEANRRIAEQILSQTFGTTVHLDCTSSTDGQGEAAALQGAATRSPASRNVAASGAAPQKPVRRAETGSSETGTLGPSSSGTDSSETTDATSPAEMDAEAASHPAVEAALRLFGGTIVEVKSGDGEA